MKRWLLAHCSTVLGVATLFAACSDPVPDGSAPPDGGEIDAGAIAPDAEVDASPPDATLERCNRGFCRIELPNPNMHNLSKFVFAGIASDPSSGIWAIANGDQSDIAATAQILHLENDVFHVVDAPFLVDGPSKWPIRLQSIVSDGVGGLLAVGTLVRDGTSVLVRGTPGTFRVEPFDAPIRAAWSTGSGSIWLAGSGGALFRSAADGGWQSETTDGGDYASVWGFSSTDVYVGGTITLVPPPQDGGLPSEPGWPGGPGGPGGGPGGGDPTPVTHGYVARRSVDDAGNVTWSSWTVSEVQDLTGDRTVRAGVADESGARFWSSQRTLSRRVDDGGVTTWIRDPFEPPITVRSFWSRAHDDVWAVGDMGRIYRFDGVGWKDASLAFDGAPLVTNLTAIAGTASGQLFVLGEDIALRSEGP